MKNTARSIAVLIVLTLTASIFAQEKPEISLDEVRSQKVNFINRSARPASRDARLNEIKTGEDLSKPISEGKTDVKYNGVTLKRLFDPAKPGYGADILIINPNANYGHINALHRILSGYIAKTFQYDLNEADTLARYILYYNAHHRNDLEGVKQKYSEDVVSSVDKTKIGIDVNYKNWSGRTQILMPLKKNIVRPNGTDLNNGELDKTVGEEGTATEQKKLDEIQDERKQEDLKKLDEKEKELTKKEDTLKQEEKKLAAEEKKTSSQIQQKDKEITELKKDPVKNKEEIQKQETQKQNLQQKQQETAQKKEQVKKEQTQVKEQKQEVAAQKKETAAGGAAGGQSSAAAQKTDPQTAAKMEQLQQENQALKQQEQARQEKSENVVGEKILFMHILETTSENHFHSELWAIDTAKDDVLFRSPYHNICGREFTVLPGQGILVIGFPDDPAHSSEHRLVILDQESLMAKKEGTDVVYFRTPVKFMDNKIYAIGIHQSMYHLMRMNPDLTLDVRSDTPVSSDSEITFTKDKIYLTGKKANGVTQITVLKRSDLTHIKTFEPKEQSRTGGAGAVNLP